MLYPDDYRSLPMAGVTESMSSAEMDAATEMAKNLASEQLMHYFSATARVGLGAAILRNPHVRGDRSRPAVLCPGRLVCA